MHYELRKKSAVLSCLLIAVFVCATQLSSATADTLSAVGGISFGRNSGLNGLSNFNPLAGAQYTFSLSPRWELGGFYSYTILTMPDGNSGSLTFMGMLLRHNFSDPTEAGIFVDTKLGVAERQEIDLTSNQIPAAGVGAGYRIPLSKVTSLGPRVDVDYLPDSTDVNSPHAIYTSFALMFSLHL